MTVQHEHSFRATSQLALSYLLYLPDHYDAPEAASPWPLVLFLHGAGERGDQLWDVARHGLPKVIEAGMRFPFIAVSPQCPADGWWDADALSALLDHVAGQYAVDPDRIVITGLSMGGFGTWALAMKQPHRFAAIAPVCGGGDSSRVCSLAHLPIWAFHGARDEVVPLARSTELINALYQCDGNPRFTVYPNTEHDSWTVTYENPRLYQWLLAQRRRR